ncbi:MAG: HDIG domain-containing protein [Armatimonadetes bacterium]|nr:HDIG domain-containing protein [Armatimonadota bacterium]
MTKSPKIWTRIRLLQRRYLKPHSAKRMKEAPLHGFDKAKAALMFFTIFALSLLLTIHFLPTRISLKVGDISKEEIRSSRSVYYYDSVQTERAQRANELSIAPVFMRAESASLEAERTVREYFTRLEDLRTQFANARPHLSPALFLARTPPQLRSDLTDASLEYVLTVPPAVSQKLSSTTLKFVQEAMERDIRDKNRNEQPANDIDIVRQSILSSAKSLCPNAKEANIITAVADQAIRPNSIYNRAATRFAREKAVRETPAKIERIALGDRIIGAGEVVKQEHIDKFSALGLINPRIEIATGTAVAVLAGGMVILVAFKIRRTMPKLYADTRRLTLLSVIVLLSVFGLKVGATMLGLQFSSGQLGYLGMSSVAAAGMLVCVLLDAHLAVLIAALLAVLSGLVMNHEIRFTVMTMMSSLVGISCVDNVHRRTNAPLISGVLSITNIGLVWLLGLLLNDSLQEVVTGTGWVVGSAIVTTFLFWCGGQLLEKPFGILTHTVLLELSQFDRPLLQQLCAVAPGTYAHSIMVGTLAEAGANAVGAHGLLARVGGYYHDIGKMKRPDFFVENQRKENVHGRLSPSLSALIITAHVRDGVEMAKEYRLPQEIRDIVAQHHGTTLIRYFYHQALMDCGGAEEAPPGLEERFRYPGPKPQTREAAIVMLADTVEAATRTLDKPSPERLEAMLNTLVHDKLEDGQMDDCDLTFRDVKLITDAFMHVLRAMMHERIDYPQMPKNATGQPMEIVREDLRANPLTGRLPLPASPEEAIRFAEMGAISGIENTSDEVQREIRMHLNSEQSSISEPQTLS